MGLDGVAAARGRRPTGPSPPSGRAPRRRCGSPGLVPSSSAMPARMRRSGSDDGTSSTASKGRGRPSQVTNVPALSLTGATGKTTSATRVTSLSRSSRATTNDAAVERRTEGRGVGRVVGVDAAHDQAVNLAGVDGGDDLVGVAAGRLGQAVDAPRGGGVDPGGSIGDRTAAGQQVGQAPGLDRTPVAGASRHPGQLGAGLAAPLRPQHSARRARWRAARRPGSRRSRRCRGRHGRAGLEGRAPHDRAWSPRAGRRASGGRVRRTARSR